MRVINATNLELKEFVGSTLPYAILSHTWSEGEVTLQQYRDWRSAHSEYFTKDEGSGRDPSIAPVEIALLDRIKSGEYVMSSEIAQHQGLLKILRCADRALSDGYNYIWVDTCCIDKTSSAELQEAINSMFRWYEEAGTCYAYLSDVDKWTLEYGKLGNSRWFYRGWTLQELIAPKDVLFLDSNWMSIGRKIQMLDVLEQATGIHRAYLQFGSANLENASIATRMSWAAKRETKREEDMAYCLLGIFGIHMPMLYGEGNRAFQRLQLEIMKASGDASIMAWDFSRTWVPASWKQNGPFARVLKTVFDDPGLLATSPFQYTKCQDIVRSEADSYETATSFSMSQHGLEIDARIRWDPIQRRIFYVDLACWMKSSHADYSLVLPLMVVQDQGGTRPAFLAMRKRWLVPMLLESKSLTHGWHVRRIRVITHAQQELMSHLSLNFNTYIFDPVWDFIGMYPPGPETLLISRSNIQIARMMGYADYPHDQCQSEPMRILCWKRRSDGTRITVFIDVKQALTSQCIQESLENPQKGWCWIAKLERPFNLECAQQLLTTMYDKQNMPLFDLRDNLGFVIPFHQILSYLDEVQAQRRLGKGDIVPEASIRTVDVNEFL